MCAAVGSLREALGEVADLDEATRVLYWDMETYLPAGGFVGRGQVLSTLTRRSHDLFASEQLARLLEAAETEVAALDFESDEASLVRVTRRDHDRERRIPSELVGEMAEASAAASPAWREAREKADFKLFAPHLAANLDLSRRRAEAIGFESRPFDALLYTEPGMTTAQLEAIFAQLKEAIVPLVRRIVARSDRVDDSCLHGDFPAERQLDFVKRVITGIGYDFGRGRMDASAHPFMIGINPGDVRLTNRVTPDFLPMSLFGGIHESGHGMYGQGIASELARTPLWEGASPGIHESQSRLYENLVGRSRPFWKHWFGDLQTTFPERLGKVDVEGFYRAINKVQPSLIRVEADEVTYNLHILLRFEIENDLLEERLRVDEVPAAWSAKMEEYLAVEPRNHAEGALQDIHWTFSGEMGIFPAYTIGNLVGAQLMEAIEKDLPDHAEQFAAGEFAPLLGWLHDRVHRHGRKFTPAELLDRAIGQPMDAGPWIAYIERKFGEIYGLR
jgi:carboxypeptidase Taq